MSDLVRKDENGATAEEEIKRSAGEEKSPEPSGKKVSRWSYERHIVQCPVCGKDILDHMTVCPFCKSEITIGGVKPLNQDTLHKVKIIALIAGIIIAIVIIVPILMKKFGG